MRRSLGLSRRIKRCGMVERLELLLLVYFETFEL